MNRTDASSPAPPDLTDAATFKVWTEMPIRFSDTDAMGHVSNVSYAAYLEAARFDVFHSVFGATHNPTSAAILAALNISFLREVTFPGNLKVGTCITHIGTKSFGISNGIFKEGTCVATGTSIIVTFDYTARQSIPIADELRAKLAAL